MMAGAMESHEHVYRSSDWAQGSRCSLCLRERPMSLVEEIGAWLAIVLVFGGAVLVWLWPAIAAALTTQWGEPWRP